MLKVMLARILMSRPISAVITTRYRNHIPFDGLHIWTDHPAVHHRTKAALFWGFYEKSERRMIKRFLPRDVPVIELGASIGGVTNVARRVLDSDQPMVSVEANPYLIPLIEKNLAANGQGGKVKILHGAIAYCPGDTVRFAVDDISTDSHVADASHTGNVQDVPKVTLAQIVAEQAFARYAIICDIEGAEYDLIAHDLEAFCNAETIIIELHDTASGAKAEALLQTILETGHMRLRERHGNVCVLTRST